MEVSSKNKCWRMEHRDLHPYSVFGDYVGEDWITWKTEYEFNCALEKLIEMTQNRRVDKNGVKVEFYSYRIRNIETEEIIPGELLVWT